MNKGDNEWVREEVQGDTSIVMIENLQPQTTYYFKLQTKTSKGTGPFSAMVHYTTPTGDYLIFLNLYSTASIIKCF